MVGGWEKSGSGVLRNVVGWAKARCAVPPICKRWGARFVWPPLHLTPGAQAVPMPVAVSTKRATRRYIFCRSGGHSTP